MLQPSSERSDEEATSGIPRGLLYMAAAAFFFSVMSLLVKIAGQRLPSQEVVLARAVVTLALSWAMLRRARTPPWGHRRGLLLLRGLLGFLALSAFYYSVVHLPLADATVIQYTNPVFTALIAAVVLRESMGGKEVVAVGASLAGVVLMTRPSFLFPGGAPVLDPVAVAIGLAGAILSASAYVAVRKLGQTEASLVIVFYFSLVSTVGAIPGTAVAALWPTPLEWLVLLGVGVSTQLGQVYMTKGLKRERAGRAMTVGYLQIVFAGAWGALFFGEIPGAWSLLGAGLVISGTALLAWRAPAGRATRAN